MSTVVGVLSFRIGVDLYLQSYGYYSHCRHPLFDLHHVADITCFWKRSNKQRAVYSLSGAKLASMGLFQIYTIYVLHVIVLECLRCTRCVLVHP